MCSVCKHFHLTGKQDSSSISAKEIKSQAPLCHCLHHLATHRSWMSFSQHRAQAARIQKVWWPCEASTQLHDLGLSLGPMGPQFCFCTTGIEWLPGLVLKINDDICMEMLILLSKVFLFPSALINPAHGSKASLSRPISQRYLSFSTLDLLPELASFVLHVPPIHQLAPLQTSMPCVFQLWVTQKMCSFLGFGGFYFILSSCLYMCTCVSFYFYVNHVHA